MPAIPRLNGAIRALEQGQPAFVTFAPADTGTAQTIGDAPYDAVVFEMEHNQWIAKQVQDSGVYGVVWPHVSTVEVLGAVAHDPR